MMLHLSSQCDRTMLSTRHTRHQSRARTVHVAVSWALSELLRRRRPRPWSAAAQMARQRAEDAHQVKLDAMIDVRKRQAGAWPRFVRSHGQPPCKHPCRMRPGINQTDSADALAADRRPGTRTVATSKAARIDEVLDQMQHGSYGYVRTRRCLCPSRTQSRRLVITHRLLSEGRERPRALHCAQGADEGG